MPTYKVAEGRELSHSERVDVVVPTFPKATVAVGYEGRMLAEGDEVELPEADGERLVEAGVLEAPKGDAEALEEVRKAPALRSVPGSLRQAGPAQPR